MAQLEGSGRGSLGAYDASGYEDLAFMLHNEPMKDGDVWLLKLMQKNYNVGAALARGPCMRIAAGRARCDLAARYPCVTSARTVLAVPWRHPRCLPPLACRASVPFGGDCL